MVPQQRRVLGVLGMVLVVLGMVLVVLHGDGSDCPGNDPGI